MVVIRLNLTEEEADRLEILSYRNDKGAPLHGHQSPPMETLGRKIRTALAEQSRDYSDPQHNDNGESAELPTHELGGESGGA